jgi:hypothetical protein
MLALYSSAILLHAGPNPPGAAGIELSGIHDRVAVDDHRGIPFG